MQVSVDELAETVVMQALTITRAEAEIAKLEREAELLRRTVEQLTPSPSEGVTDGPADGP